MLKLDTLVPTIFIVIFNSNNKLVLIMMYGMLYIFSFLALEKLDVEVLDF